jgi:hypothetical protein
MEAHHEYRVHAFGAGGRNGVVQAEGVLSSISFSPPPEFLGEPGRWTPEHFLVAVVASCFVSTFSGIAPTLNLCPFVIAEHTFCIQAMVHINRVAFDVERDVPARNPFNTAILRDEGHQ